MWRLRSKIMAYELSDHTYTPLEKDKLLYYFNCYNECDEVAYPYGETK